jgi:hypothetical protein
MVAFACTPPGDPATGGAAARDICAKAVGTETDRRVVQTPESEIEPTWPGVRTGQPPVVLCMVILDFDAIHEHPHSRERGHKRLSDFRDRIPDLLPEGCR